MPESWKSRRTRWFFNLYPPFWGSGVRVTHIAEDWSEVRVEARLNWRSRNYVGTIFGGSLYTAADPFYMVMLVNRLGRDYLVWDKSATIRFQKPGRTTLYARFVVDDEELTAIREAMVDQRSIDRHYTVELKDAKGVVHATVEKTIYIRRKNSPQ